MYIRNFYRAEGRAQKGGQWQGGLIQKEGSVGRAGSGRRLV
jgi:hypothetical protein